MLLEYLQVEILDKTRSVREREAKKQTGLRSERKDCHLFQAVTTSYIDGELAEGGRAGGDG